MLGKRGQEAVTVKLWFVIIGLILAGVVSLSFVAKTVQTIKGTTLEKNFIARDIALALDAVYAAPGDVEYTYSMKNYKFVVEIRNSKVFVKESPSEADSIAGIYDYFDGQKDEDKLSVRIIPNKDSPLPALLVLNNKNDKVFVKAERALVEENAKFA